MELIPERSDLNDYLRSDEYVNFYDLSIQRKADELFASASDEKIKIKKAFEFVRDEMSHSADINSERLTKSASEVLLHKEGICIAKSLLLAALLRYGGIPAGFCYQRLTRGDTPGSGYIIHGLNAVFLSDEKRWIRLDARGNKENVDVQFSTDEEKIAYPIRAEYGELDYPVIYAEPKQSVMEAMERSESRSEYDISEL